MMNGTEPSTAPDGMSLHLLVKNVGKHPANITDISTIPTVHIINKELPPMPDYKEHRNILTIEGTGPIVPSDTIDLMMHSVQQNFRFANR
jgi:hypothetical protein